MKTKKPAKPVKHRPGTLERQQFKNSVRRSPEWAALRMRKLKEQSYKDPLTLRNLSHRSNCHHLQCEDWKLYNDLSPDKFVMLTIKSHDTIHFLWDIVKRENSLDVLDRVADILKRMAELNGVEIR